MWLSALRTPLLSATPRSNHAAAPARPAAAAGSGPLICAVLAAAAPSLLAYNLPPSPTLLNQALALGLWGAFVFVFAHQRRRLAGAGGPALAALGLLCLGVLWSWATSSLPASLALSSLGLLLAAGVMLASGLASGLPTDTASTDAHTAHAADTGDAAFVCFCWAWLIAGLLNTAVAAIQVFAPALADGQWLAASGIVGRAVGNLRQPNHLSSLLLWAVVALVALVELRRLRHGLAAALGALLVAAVVLTASRTGLLSVALLALWGLLDRRLNGRTRLLLLAAPLVYGLAWWGMVQWAALAQHTFGGAQRLAETDISGSRFGIWTNAWALLMQQPWTGVGWGNFNMAWTLTPFPGRPTAFFDHTHNLPLQLAVELGLPLAGAVMALMLWALWRSASAALRAAGDAGTQRRCALVMVLMIVLHSLLEYPLWYAYFLLPAAWALGVALNGGAAASARSATPPMPTQQVTTTTRAPSPGLRSGASRSVQRLLPWGAAAMVAAAGLAVWDYSRVVAIYRAGTGDAPLAQRIAAGQQSWLFGHHADYAAVTAEGAKPDPRRDFDRTARHLLDTRLMLAWTQALAGANEVDAARHLAARLREFRRADQTPFFEACKRADAGLPAAGLPVADAEMPYQCQKPVRDLNWRSFLP